MKRLSLKRIKSSFKSDLKTPNWTWMFWIYNLPLNNTAKSSLTSKLSSKSVKITMLYWDSVLLRLKVKEINLLPNSSKKSLNSMLPSCNSNLNLLNSSNSLLHLKLSSKNAKPTMLCWDNALLNLNLLMEMNQLKDPREKVNSPSSCKTRLCLKKSLFTWLNSLNSCLESSVFWNKRTLNSEWLSSRLLPFSKLGLRFKLLTANSLLA